MKIPLIAVVAKPASNVSYNYATTLVHNFLGCLHRYLYHKPPVALTYSSVVGGGINFIKFQDPTRSGLVAPILTKLMFLRLTFMSIAHRTKTTVIFFTALKMPFLKTYFL